MNDFEIIDFRFANKSDKFDLKYEMNLVWSRCYEYKYVLDFIKNNKKEKTNIHNSSWGFEKVHVLFRDELDIIGECVHSDIVKSDFRKTYFYDITTQNEEFKNKFDFVLNISTIEHLHSAKNRLLAISNLFEQTKAGGYLIISFDYPSVDLDEIEKLVNKKCEICIDRLNGENSVVKNTKNKHLNIVYLILKKIK